MDSTPLVILAQLQRLEVENKRKKRLQKAWLNLKEIAFFLNFTLVLCDISSRFFQTCQKSEGVFGSGRGGLRDPTFAHLQSYTSHAINIARACKA